MSRKLFNNVSRSDFLNVLHHSTAELYVYVYCALVVLESFRGFLARHAL